MSKVMSSARCPTSCLRTTSIPSTAVSEVSTVHASTNILDGGSETVDGNVPKLLSGKKKMLMSSPFLRKSRILLEQLKKSSSTENLGFPGDFNCTNTSRSTLCEEETINEKKIGSKRKVVTDINLLHDGHAKVLKSYSEWEQSVHARFTAGDGRTIRSMITGNQLGNTIKNQEFLRSRKVSCEFRGGILKTRLGTKTRV